MARRIGVLAKDRQGKDFFFEKKKQKTLLTKVFWFFFSKKNKTSFTGGDLYAA